MVNTLVGGTVCVVCVGRGGGGVNILLHNKRGTGLESVSFLFNNQFFTVWDELLIK